MDSATVREPVLLMARYNLWANVQFVQYLRGQNPVLIAQHVPGSFPSLQKTLLHIWDAQHIWYKRLHGESPVAFLSNSWTGTLDELLEGLLKSSNDFVEYTEALEIHEFQEIVNYTTISSGSQSSQRYEILLHVFNHSMYHRGQLVTMAHTLGLQGMPSTDLIRYLRQ